MSTKKFKADVSAAAQKAAGGAIAGIASIAHGDSDGEVAVTYRHQGLPRDVRIRVLAQDVSEYPDGNMFMLWTDDPDPPPAVVAAINAVQDYLLGISVYEMAKELADRLEKEVSRALDGREASPVRPLGEEDEDPDSEDDYDAAYDTDYPSDGDEFGLPSSAPRHAHRASGVADHNMPLLQRLRRDLRQVRQAGYKVGFLDSFGKATTSGIVSISIRIDKLALSDAAMEAWDLRPTEYVVLLLRVLKRYDPLERVLAQAAALADLSFRIGKCSKYKPSLTQALGAFADVNYLPTTEGAGADPADPEHSDAAFEQLFVSNSLNQFLCESFVSLLKIRETSGLDWEQANELFLQTTGLCGEQQPLLDTPLLTDADGGASDAAAIPEPHHILGPVHLREMGPASERSVPLIAMQFAMRYFVKCTEYCLRCHRRLEKGFEALRPYVCSNPLCLFQYMAMGFGPAIEHEILTEPYVVDLLVSLCYAAIQPFYNYTGPPPAPPNAQLSIRSLPVGLRLRVPDLSNATADPLKARTVSASTQLLVFEHEAAKDLGDRLAPTRWLAYRRPGQTLTYHARVVEVRKATRTAVVEVMGQSSFYYSGLDQHLYNPVPGAQQSGPGRPEDSIVDVFPYDADFDSLDVISKGVIMHHILDTLPPILDIEEWLLSHPRDSFRSMDRISPAAASLLQWIVSSNRSCIFQVDRSRALARRGAKQPAPQGPGTSTAPAGTAGAPSAAEENSRPAGRGRSREHERILGMDGWVQFRFAQGSPDKELRFNRALQEVAARKPIQSHPTIFAWHGSSLCNWHSIVRTGLDFKDIRCGRAYGHGVYFSPNYSTSLAYAGMGRPWPNSDLMITTCMSLNEIINAPDEFVSRDPHYVVSQLDWHQCRYLFVQTSAGLAGQQQKQQQQRHPRADAKTKKTTAQGETEEMSGEACDQLFYPQAPGLEVYGRSGKPLQIPRSAIPVRPIGPAAPAPLSPAKRTAGPEEDSDDEDAEDMAILFTDDETSAAAAPPLKKSTSRGSSVDSATVQDSGLAGPPTPASIILDRSLTDFKPGALDLESLPRLQPPSFANDLATRALGHELMRLQALQSKTPLHELGWYMDFDNVTNMFQWIVELHSFDPALPLAQDMKQAGITSVVLELRFAPDYPFSPPFVRVVRPRFLPFVDGGGGHVTAGGAMCMQLLTSSGWSPATSMESVLLQVRVAMCSTEPAPARLDRRLLAAAAASSADSKGKQLVVQDYGVMDALEAYMRAARAHGWGVPENLRLTAMGS